MEKTESSLANSRLFGAVALGFGVPLCGRFAPWHWWTSAAALYVPIAMGLVYLLGLVLLCHPWRRYRAVLLVCLVAWGGYALWGVVTPLGRWSMTSPGYWGMMLLFHLAVAGVAPCALLCGVVYLRNRFWPPPAPGHCRFCGYNLHGAVSPRCPECGSLRETDSVMNEQAGQADTPAGNSTETSRMSRAQWPGLLLVVLVSVASGALGAFIFSQRTAITTNVVRADRFELLGPRGDLRAVLEPRPGAGAKLRFLDPLGATRLALAVDEAGFGGLTLYNSAAGPVAWLGERLGGKSHLIFYDLGGKARIGLGVAAQASPGMYLCDQAGKTRGLFALDSDGIGLSLFDQKSDMRGLLMLAPDGRPVLRMLGAGQKGQYVAGVDTDLGPFAEVYDSNGTCRAGFGLSEKGEGLIEVYDEEKETIWQAPPEASDRAAKQHPSETGPTNSESNTASKSD